MYICIYVYISIYMYIYLVRFIFDEPKPQRAHRQASMEGCVHKVLQTLVKVLCIDKIVYV